MPTLMIGTEFFVVDADRICQIRDDLHSGVGYYTVFGPTW
jgi:hypothetical protein